MIVSVVQPYFFPYIGYYQLIDASDVFIFYDNVQYIKGGWINRNRILVNGKEHYITIPLKKASSNRLINEIEPNVNEKFIRKTLKTLRQAYSKAPFLENTIEIVEEVLRGRHKTIADMAMDSIIKTVNYLDISIQFEVASKLEIDMSHDRSERLIQMTKLFGGSTYINPVGGSELYDKAHFKEKHVELKFLNAKILPYDQGLDNGYVPGLSMIDILMHNDRVDIMKMMKAYNLS